MAVGEKVEIKCREVKRLADLWGVRRDLEIARKQCELALKSSGQDEASWLLVDGMTTSSLVRYMRCFGGGQRSGLSVDDLSGLSEEFVQTHEHFKHLRDKHIAHSVNHYEQCYITSHLQAETQDEHFDGLYGNSGRVVQNERDAKSLLALIEEVEWVAIRLWQEEHDRALDAVNALPRSTVEAFTPRPAMTVNPSKIKIPRSQ